eukprot:636484-Rhodomonas_salina.3
MSGRVCVAHQDSYSTSAPGIRSAIGRELFYHDTGAVQYLVDDILCCKRDRHRPFRDSFELVAWRRSVPDSA